MKRILLSFATVLALSPTPSFAGSVYSTIVQRIYIMNNGTVLIYANKPTDTPPPCATQGRWAFNGTTPAGQAKLSYLMNAKASRSLIHLHGLHNCDVWSDSETLDYMGDE